MDRPVFISYSRRDQDAVLAWAERLRSAGYRPWLDQHSIAVSVPWLEEINHAIRSSVLFVIIASPSWTDSTNCRREAALADALGKPILTIPADELADAATMSQVVTAYEQAAQAEGDRARLLGDSGRWDAAGRPKGQLPRGRSLRAMRGALPRTSDDTHAQAFVRAARSASRARTTLKVATVLLTLTLWLGLQLTTRLDGAIRERYDAALRQVGTWRTTSAALEAAPYDGVRRAIESASAASPPFSALWELSTALDTSLPTDVTNPDGQRPQPAEALAAGTTVRNARGAATYRPEKSLVDVTTAALGRTVVPLDGRLTAMAWSPDGSRLALAGPAGVQIVRISTGVITTTLRGLDGAINDLEWREPAIVVGSSGTIAASWRVDSSRVLGQTDAWFMGLAANTDGSRLVAVDRRGGYVVIDARGTSSSVKIAAATRSYAVAWVTDTWVIASSDAAGKGFLTLVDADGATGRRIELGACDPTNLAAGAAHTVLVVCLADTSFTTVDVRTGAIETTPVQVQPISLGLDQQGRIVVASVYGEFLQVSNGQDRLVGNWSGLCWGGSQVLVTSPDRRRIVTAGASARSGCLRVQTDPDDPGNGHMVFPDKEAMTNVRAAIWSPDGSVLVLGYASGEVWFFDVDTFYSRQISVPTGAEIRGLAFLADGSTLVAVTRAGEVVKIPGTLPLAATAERIAEAQRRLQIGVDGGVA